MRLKTLVGRTTPSGGTCQSVPLLKEEFGQPVFACLFFAAEESLSLSLVTLTPPTSLI